MDALRPEAVKDSKGAEGRHPGELRRNKRLGTQVGGSKNNSFKKFTDEKQKDPEEITTKKTNQRYKNNTDLGLYV